MIGYISASIPRASSIAVLVATETAAKSISQALCFAQRSEISALIRERSSINMAMVKNASITESSSTSTIYSVSLSFGGDVTSDVASNSADGSYTSKISNRSRSGVYCRVHSALAVPVGRSLFTLFMFMVSVLSRGLSESRTLSITVRKKACSASEAWLTALPAASSSREKELWTAMTLSSVSLK